MYKMQAQDACTASRHNRKSSIINYDLHVHAADSQDRGKPEQAKAKAMPFKRVKRIEFLKSHQGTERFASLPH